VFRNTRKAAVRKLIYAVNVGTPDPWLEDMLLERFGGENVELAAAAQWTKILKCLKELVGERGAPHLENHGIWAPSGF
jgi:hypothetical protein